MPNVGEPNCVHLNLLVYTHATTPLIGSYWVVEFLWIVSAIYGNGRCWTEMNQRPLLCYGISSPYGSLFIRPLFPFDFADR